MARQEDSAAQPKRPFTISKETTYFTDPLKPDGSIDFIAAVNEHFAQGVTPENNAARIIVPLLPVKSWDNSEHRNKNLIALGLDPAHHNEKEALISWNTISKKPSTDTEDSYEDPFEKFYEDPWKAADRPWNDREFPELKKWLDANESTLDRICEGLKRSQYFNPIVPNKNSDDLIFASLSPEISCILELSRQLSARANYHLANHRYEDSWADILALNRLGRLLCQMPTGDHLIAGYAAVGYSCHSASLFVKRGGPETKWLDCLKSWDSGLGGDIPDTIDVAERAISIENICRIPVRARGVSWYLSLPNDDDPPDRIRQLVDKFFCWNLERLIEGGHIDLDVTLRSINQSADDVTKVLEIEDPGQCHNELERRASAIPENLERELPAHIKVVLASPETRSQRFAEAVAGIHDLPTIGLTLHQSKGRLESSHRVIKLALAARVFQSQTGKLPRALKELNPNVDVAMLAEAPSLFPIEFQIAGKEIVIYHWGVDRVDDGGDIDGENPKDWGILIKN